MNASVKLLNIQYINLCNKASYTLRRRQKTTINAKIKQMPKSFSNTKYFIPQQKKSYLKSQGLNPIKKELLSYSYDELVI